MRSSTYLKVFGTVLGVVLAFPGAATAAYAPVSARGPALTVPKPLLNASLVCGGALDHATREPVLLVHGTNANVKDNWSWTYVPAFRRLQIPWCTVELPDHATADIQTSAEYVVSAIRTMHARARRQIAVMGHSQGGMLPRWALRFWPDVRAMVEDDVGFAGTNHGTTEFDGTGPSEPAEWQQASKSRFVAALNSRQETFRGISYTMIYTHTDETVKPSSGPDACTSCLHGGGGRITNIATQQICAGDIYEHLLIGTIDPVAYALAIDAITHDGPADQRRVRPTICAGLVQPGMDLTWPLGGVAAALDAESYKGATVPAEPPLRCYVFAGAERRRCAASAHR